MEEYIWEAGITSTFKMVNSAQNNKYPQYSKNFSCVMILTNVLVKPDWINVPCNEKIYVMLVCQTLFNRGRSLKLEKDTHFLNQDVYPCTEGKLTLGRKCLYFKVLTKSYNLPLIEGNMVIMACKKCLMIILKTKMSY